MNHIFRSVNGDVSGGGGSRHDLTVCTVSFRNTSHLALNFQLTDKLCTGPNSIQWAVAENSPTDTQNRFTIGNNPDWLTILPGVEGDYPPNLHHTLALNACVAQVRTRFLLVLDPDFYILWADWANAVLDHMIDKGLAVFGVPWHPRHGFKYRYFPCVHCVFIDLDRIPLDTLDFRPPTDENAPSPTGLVDRFLSGRRGYPTDSGTLFYWRYFQNPLAECECAVPVFHPKKHLPEFGATLKGRISHRVLPDRFCYVPKRKGAYTEVGFEESGFNVSLDPNWEQFMWKNRPFGFHVRRNWNKKARTEQDEIEALQRLMHTELFPISDPVNLKAAS